MIFTNLSFRCFLPLLGAGLALPLSLQAQLRMPAAKAPVQIPLISMPSARGDRKPGVVRFSSMNNALPLEESKQAMKLTDGATYEGLAKSLTRESLVFDIARGGTLRASPRELDEISFARDDKPVNVPVSVLLRDGSTLALEALTLADGEVECRSVGGGQFRLPQAALAKVALYPNQGQIFRGDGEATEMVMSPPQAWKSERGTWLLTGQVERGMLAWKADFPSRMVLEFTTNQTDFGMTLFRSAPDSSSPYGAVSLLVQDNAISISQFDGQGYVCPVRALPMLFAEGLEPIRHVIYCDVLEGLIVVTRNGVLIGKFYVSMVGKKDLDQLGKFLHFLGRPGFEVSQVKVRPWLGLVPPAPISLAEHDVVEVGAERLMSGTVTGISEQEMTLAGGEKIGRDKPLLIHFRDRAAAPAVADGMVVVELMGGGELRNVAVQFKDDEMIARNATLGEVKLPLTAVRRMEFARPVPELPVERLARNPDTLTWSDGSQLNGTMLPVLASGAIRWRISAAQEILEFPVADVRGVQPTGRTQEPPQDGLTGVEFRNGDWLVGKLLQVNAATMAFQPPFGETLTLERNQVSALYHANGALALTDGGPGREWQQVTRIYEGEARGYRYEPSQRPRWRYFAGVHTMAASRGGNRGDLLTLTLPESSGPMSVEFTVSGEGGNYLLLGEDDAPLFSCYLSPIRITISRLADPRDKAAVRAMGNQDRWGFPLKSSGKNVRHQLAFDPVAKRIYIGQDGAVIGTCAMNSKRPWKDVRKVAWMPNFNRPTTDLAVSDVWVHPAPALPPDHAAPTPENPWFALSNGDHAQALRCAFTGDAWKLETEGFGELEVPCARISALVFADQGETKSEKDGCRVRLRNAGSLSGSAVRLEPDGVHLTCWLGELVLPLNAVSEIVWPAPAGQK